MLNNFRRVCLYQARSLLALLAEVQGLGDHGSVELFRRHMVQVLHSMKSTYQSWTQHSLERVVFDTLILEAGLVPVAASSSRCCVHMQFDYSYKFLNM